ncbi:hypothetical protein [Alkalibaculum sporogenes]|uniref:hypothetical protein n=1 Tax=Alkalibaculum sporogenes TaxID=2655001 RepID=UPI001A9AB0F7|nr:hypothetical protein [Alkalibaculum sporogenes]
MNLAKLPFAQCFKNTVYIVVLCSLLFKDKQRYKDTKIQRYKDTKIQRYKDTKIQRYKDTKIQRHKDTKTQRQKIKDKR